MSSSPVQAACNHTKMGHMFYHVLCPAQSLTKRATTVAFGCLLLVGVLFAAYSAISKYFFTPATKLAETYPDPDPEIGKTARQFTLDSLTNYPDTTALQFVNRGFDASQMNQPVNPQIAVLANLYWDIHYEAFVEVMKHHQNNPWDQEEVLQAADALMKVAYTIGCLTLEDLKPFTERLKGKGDERTYAKALVLQDSYQYRTFYYCTNAYHWIRGGIAWDGKQLEFPGGPMGPMLPIPDTFAQLFYQEGTKQHSWNQLYNDYCNRVRSYVKEGDLEDKRHVNWTVKDTGIKTFDRTPDTQPT
jgi:hypothetical protein